jgi:hemerythrin superfamily protein
MATTPGATDVVSMVMADHRKVQNFYEQFNATNDLERKQVLAWEIIKYLSVHSAKEEMALYPTVAEKLGREAADHLLQEHQQLKEALYHLDSLKASDAEFLPQVEKSMQILMQHIKEEEETFLPKLAANCTAEELNKLGKDFHNAESKAPTRPHPAAPNKPPLNIAANLTAVPLDMAKDKLRFRNVDEPATYPSSGTAAT